MIPLQFSQSKHAQLDKWRIASASYLRWLQPTLEDRRQLGRWPSAILPQGSLEKKNAASLRLDDEELVKLRLAPVLEENSAYEIHEAKMVLACSASL
jgi:hypothetical protein